MTDLVEQVARAIADDPMDWILHQEKAEKIVFDIVQPTARDDALEEAALEIKKRHYPSQEVGELINLIRALKGKTDG